MTLVLPALRPAFITWQPTDKSLALLRIKDVNKKGYSSSALLVTTDNYNAGVKSLKDLKGKRIGITQKGSTFHYMLGRMLETQGMSLNDVEIVPLSKLSAVMAALESKQIDGCILNEPNITKVQKSRLRQTGHTGWRRYSLPDLCYLLLT